MYDVQMEDLALSGVLRQALTHRLLPIIRAALPQFSNVVAFEDVYAKIVKYTAIGEADRDWPVHIDESDVTVNLCLGPEGFEGSDLQIVTTSTPDVSIGTAAVGELSLCTYRHRPMRALFHVGTLPHGVSLLRSGERVSIIMLLNRARLADGAVVVSKKLELSPAEWDAMLALQDATARGSASGSCGGLPGMVA